RARIWACIAGTAQLAVQPRWVRPRRPRSPAKGCRLPRTFKTPCKSGPMVLMSRAGSRLVSQAVKGNAVLVRVQTDEELDPLVPNGSSPGAAAGPAQPACGSECRGARPTIRVNGSSSLLSERP